jgi:hypothetical protein
MEQSHSWEGKRLAASQNIPHVSWNAKVDQRVHTCPQPVSIPRQLDPVHASTSQFLMIHLNIILLSTPGFSKWTLSRRSPHKNHVYASPILHTCYMRRPLYSSRFDNPKDIGWLLVLEVAKPVAAVGQTCVTAQFLYLFYLRAAIQLQQKRYTKHQTQSNTCTLGNCPWILMHRKCKGERTMWSSKLKRNVIGSSNH